MILLLQVKMLQLNQQHPVVLLVLDLQQAVEHLEVLLHPHHLELLLEKMME